MQLPIDLQSALEKMTRLRGSVETKQAALAVSSRYREGRRDAGEVMVSTDLQAAAYAATRMPATWAALRICMAHVSELVPEWSPAVLLDAGAGTGAAAWAATGVWPGLTGCRLLERADGMVRIGRELAANAGHPALRSAEWLSADLRSGVCGHAADLVTAAYVLNEMGGEELEPALTSLWKSCSGVLILVEPGTPDGWQRILQARSILQAQDAHILAPCPHGNPCPVSPPDWCHFTERVNRLRTHRQLKEADAPYEDEKYAWLAVATESVSSRSVSFPARIRRHPEVHSGFIRLALCTKNGLSAETVGRSRKDAWKAVRDASNGDVWPFDTKNPA